MKTKVFQSHATQARLELGPFHPYLDEFYYVMKEAQYPEKYIKDTYRVILKLSDWVGLRHFLLTDFDEKRIEEFLVFHKESRNDHTDHRRLGKFIFFLRKIGVIPQEVEREITCPNEILLSEFEKYLKTEKGLSTVYIYQQVRSARLFLHNGFPEAQHQWELLNAQIISDYLSRLLRKTGPSEAKDAAKYLVQFFKYLYIKGKTNKDFSRVVPRPANWRHTRLPIYITPDKVERLFASCDLQTQIGSRDYAILILLSRLALRGCEVKNLNLDDIHWKAGEITVRGKAGNLKCLFRKKLVKQL